MFSNVSRRDLAIPHLPLFMCELFGHFEWFLLEIKSTRFTQKWSLGKICQGEGGHASYFLFSRSLNCGVFLSDGVFLGER